MIRDDAVYLRHILDAINQVEEYVTGLDQEAFMSSRLVQDGVIRQFEIIGEATKHLTEALKGQQPDIPWKDIAGMRDKLIHQYFGVDPAAVWETVVYDLPPLKTVISRMLAATP
ncbi:MAG TPA: DUF86 domain-containing protein [Geobacteraceae bacterium]|nr:DUF86 domain-containing protein [Geobacteraceae bacterium]